MLKIENPSSEACGMNWNVPKCPLVSCVAQESITRVYESPQIQAAIYRVTILISVIEWLLELKSVSV
jgi:hypothetical protein